jgi:lipopolysaccharide export system permease protein
MRTLTRYILWEVSLVFLLTLSSMTIFVFLALVGKEAVENGLGVSPILRMLPYMLPQAMQFAVPGALLMAATSVYGRVSSSNEIVAIKSLGISPMVMVWPTLILATLISFGAVVLNDVAVSWGRGGVDRVILESLEEIAYGRLRTAKHFSTDNNRLRVNVKRVEGHRLVDPIIQVSGGEGRESSLIRADYAEIDADVTAGAVSIKLVNAAGVLDGWNISHPGEFVRSFSMAEFTGRNFGDRHPTSYALTELNDAKANQVGHINNLRREMAADAAAALLFGRMSDLSQQDWQARENHIAGAQNTRHRLFTEPYRRWANGFSCLGFVLIGAPMAIRRRHGEFWGSFFACFLPILLVYYPMLVGCLDRAKDGEFPPQAVWLGNLVLAAWGVWLLRRVIRF